MTAFLPRKLAKKKTKEYAKEKKQRNPYYLFGTEWANNRRAVFLEFDLSRKKTCDLSKSACWLSFMQVIVFNLCKYKNKNFGFCSNINKS